MNFRSLKTLVAVALVCVLSVPLIARTIRINVREPGTLSAEIQKLQNIKPGSKLVLSGKLNSKDIAALRLICGCDSQLNQHPTPVRLLDLSKISFLPDTASYMSLKGQHPHIESAHSLPPVMLYGCGIEEIVLPERLDTIREWSLANTRLKKLYIRDGVVVKPRALAVDSLLEEVRLPFCGELYNFSDEWLLNLRKVETNGFFITSYSPFRNLQKLEEVHFNGPMGYINATPFINNSRLKRIVFNGKVFGTGTALASRCNNLEEIVFNKKVGLFHFNDIKEYNSPIRNYTFNDVVFKSYTPTVAGLDSSALYSCPGRLSFIREGAELTRKSVPWILDDESNGWFPLSMITILSQLSTPAEMQEIFPDADSIKSKMMQLDVNKSYLEILKESAPYAKGTDTIKWSYALPSDTLLARFRNELKLDSIAGNGDDVSKIKNLTRWIHDTMPHNGMREDMPTTPWDLDLLIKYANTDSLGGNCRILAVALQQALLAEGIPARYLTCQSKRYRTDNDCHVICVAWSDTLNKWIWADPTFDAFVTDENGLLLHPGEVRGRLIKDEPLFLNEDANWNHKEKQTKEYYLDNYMAKNLYVMSCWERQTPRLEGKDAIQGSELVVLVPEGFKYYDGAETTSDEQQFWKAPARK